MPCQAQVVQDKLAAQKNFQKQNASFSKIFKIKIAPKMHIFASAALTEGRRPGKFLHKVRLAEANFCFFMQHARFPTLNAIFGPKTTLFKSLYVVQGSS